MAFFNSNTLLLDETSTGQGTCPGSFGITQSVSGKDMTNGEREAETRQDTSKSGLGGFGSTRDQV